MNNDMIIIIGLLIVVGTVVYKGFRTTMYPTMSSITRSYVPVVRTSVGTCLLYNSTTMEVVMMDTRTACERMQDNMGTKGMPCHITTMAYSY